MDDLPAWAARALGTDGRTRIEEAVSAAERQTSGEIVPLLVRRSSTVGHVPLLAGALVLLLALILDLPGWLGHVIGSHHAAVAIVWLASGITGYVASLLDVVDRLLTPRGDQAHQVDLRAEVEFYELAMNETRGRTGVLLMISLLERRAVVLADRGISQKLDAGIWSEVVELMIGGVKGGDLAGGLCAAIERCGALLAEHFPIAGDDENELRNRLIVKE